MEEYIRVRVYFFLFLMVIYYLYCERYSIFLYEDPLLTEREAERFIKKAITGDDHAILVMNNHLDGSPKRARRLLKYADEIKNGDGIKLILADLLLEAGTKDSEKEAIRIYKSIAFTETAALDKLFYVYNNGYGYTEENPAKALYYSKMRDCYNTEDKKTSYLDLHYHDDFNNYFLGNLAGAKPTEHISKYFKNEQKEFKTALIMILNYVENSKGIKRGDNIFAIIEKIREKIPKKEYDYIVTNHQEVFQKECEWFYKIRHENNVGAVE